jgi:23S rRNA pseudouridine1911/1915/1917 synthase
VSQDRELRLSVPASLDGERLDLVLATLVEERSRAYLQGLIRDGTVWLNGANAAPKTKVAIGDEIRLRFPKPEADDALAQAIALHVVYEDDTLIVLDKPAGLVVHPGAGNRDGTLMNALLNHCRDLFALPRAGIVHRLDKDTSGLMVVAKTESARMNLIEAIKERCVGRIYRAVVSGRMVAGGRIDAPIGRHPRNRLKMAVTARGRPAATRYRVVERFRAHTDIEVTLETGRTHQIRVHMTAISHPLIGDPLYGGPTKARLARLSKEAAAAARAFPRQALHAQTLGFRHPVTGESLHFATNLPSDIEDLIHSLERL